MPTAAESARTTVEDLIMATNDPGTERPRNGEVHDQRPPVVIPDDEYDRERREEARRGDAEHRASRHTRVDEHRIKPAKTSAAAVFALVFGLTALYAVLTVLLFPVGIVLAVIGLILAAVGLKVTKQVGVTGKGIAASGLVLSVIALIGAVVLAAGVTTFLNDEEAVQRLENKVNDLRDDLPDNVEVPTP